MIFRLSLGVKVFGLWLYSLIVTAMIVATLCGMGQEGWLVYATGFGVNAYTALCGWFGLIREFHR